MGCNSLSSRRPAPVDGPFGFVVIDKPAGLTSHSCVGRLRRCYGLRRVGHGGTLDPAVTGVLPIALGPATRLLPYLPGDKTYRGVIQLGQRTAPTTCRVICWSSRTGPTSARPSSSRLWLRFTARFSSAPPRCRPCTWTASEPTPGPAAAK